MSTKSIKETNELYNAEVDFALMKEILMAKKKKKRYRACTRKEKQEKKNGSKLHNCNLSWNPFLSQTNDGPPFVPALYHIEDDTFYNCHTSQIKSSKSTVSNKCDEYDYDSGFNLND